MTATVDIITRKKTKIIGVPISAIVIKTDTSSAKKFGAPKDASDSAGDQQKFETVFVKDGNKAKLRVVTTGIQDDRNIEILTGLKPGDVVITGPYNTVTKSLNAGDEVTLLKAEKPKE